jgi:hypothetical protein
MGSVGEPRNLRAPRDLVEVIATVIENYGLPFIPDEDLNELEGALSSFLVFEAEKGRQLGES